MSTIFKIPEGSLETLECPAENQLHVEHVYTLSSEKVNTDKLSNLSKILNGEDVLRILEQNIFDEVYSFTKNFSRLSAAIQHKFVKIITACIDSLDACLRKLNPPSTKLHNPYRDSVSICVFFLSHTIRRGQEISDVAADKKKSIDQHRSKSIESKKNRSEAVDAIERWKKTCTLAVNSMCIASEFNFAQLWPLGIPEEKFIQILWKTGTFLLEIPFITQKEGDLLDVTVRLIAVCAKKFPAIRPSIVARLCSLLTNEQTENTNSKIAEPICKIIFLMAKQFKENCIVVGLLQEIGSMRLFEGAQDAQSLSQCCRNVGCFLIYISRNLPALVLPHLVYILPHLDSAVYPMRSAICESIGNLIVQLHQNEFSRETQMLQNDEYDENHVIKDKVSRLHSRNSLLTILMERSCDKTSFTRSATLKTWVVLVEAQVVPVHYFITLAKISSRHCLDISSLTRKVALQLFSTIVTMNPFSPILHPSYFDHQFSDLLETLRSKGMHVPDTLFSHSQDDFDVDDKYSKCVADKCVDQGSHILSEEKDLTDNLCPIDKSIGLGDQEFQTSLSRLQMAAKFSLVLADSVPKLISLLESQSTSDVIETLKVLRQCFPFKINGFESLQRKMLGLSFSRHETVRNAAVETFQALSLDIGESLEKTANHLIVAKELVCLVNVSSREEKQYFAEILSLLVKKKLIDDDIIGTLWRFVCNVDEHNVSSETIKKARSAMEVLHMITMSKPDVINNTENLGMLRRVVFGQRSQRRRDYLLAKHAFGALESIRAVGQANPCLDIMELLSCAETIICGGWGFSEVQKTNIVWYPCVQQALRAIFSFHIQPDKICEQILQRLTAKVFDTDGPKRAAELSRLFFVAGELAVLLLVHAEKMSIEAKKMRTITLEMIGSSVVSETDQQGKQQGIRLQCGFQGTEEDLEMEIFERLAEEEIVRGNLIATFAPLVHIFVRRMFDDMTKDITGMTTSVGQLFLNQSSVLTMCKFMSVSRLVCKQCITLLFDVLETFKSSENAASIRANIVISLGDLLSRFPNVVAPHCHRLYACLRDCNHSVRKNTLMVVSHLILNGMLKPNGYMAKIALCIEDKRKRISDLAKLFFSELKKRDPKRNPIYNMLPDVISQLSSDDEVSSKTFRLIIKFLLKHIDKDVQTENLVEKLCGRFQTGNEHTENRQNQLFCDFAYCLAQLPYSVKCVKRLIQCFPMYKSQITIDQVYRSFSEIVEKALKRNKDKAQIKEDILDFQRRITLAHQGKFEDDLITYVDTPSQVHGSNSLCLVEQEVEYGEQCSDSSDIGTMELSDLDSSHLSSHAILSENDTPNHQSKVNNGKPLGRKKGIRKSVAWSKSTSRPGFVL